MTRADEQALLITKYTSPPLTLPVNPFDLSAHHTEYPVGMMAWSGISSDSQVSMRQIMLQSLIFLWKEIIARSSHSLLSTDGGQQYKTDVGFYYPSRSEGINRSS